MRRTIEASKLMQDVPVLDDGPPVFECVWCGYRFDLNENYYPMYRALICPCCRAGHKEEGPHFVLEHNGKEGLRGYHRERREGKLP